MLHKCKRCGYESISRQSLRQHLLKKKACNVILEDISREDLLNDINTNNHVYNDITYNCTFCDKKFNTNSSRCRHKKTCKQAKIPITNKDLLDLESKIIDIIMKPDVSDKKEKSVDESIDDSELGYLYIIQLREFVKNNEQVYKIGKTKNIHNRCRNYPKQSILMYSIRTDKISEKETLLKSNLKQKLLQRTDLGYEYFEGDLKTIKSEIDILV
jgi:hypothetical protein